MEITFLPMAFLLLGAQGYGPVNFSTEGATFQYEQSGERFRSINFLDNPVRQDSFCFLSAKSVSGTITFNGYELDSKPRAIRIAWYSPTSCEVSASWSRKYFYVELEAQVFIRVLKSVKNFLNQCQSCNTKSSELTTWIIDGNLQRVSKNHGWFVFETKQGADTRDSIVFRKKLGKTEVLKIPSTLPLESLDLYNGK